MDFVNSIPLRQGFDVIVVVVDSLTKMRQLIRRNTTAGTAEVTAMFLAHV